MGEVCKVEGKKWENPLSKAARGSVREVHGHEVPHDLLDAGVNENSSPTDTNDSHHKK